MRRTLFYIFILCTVIFAGYISYKKITSYYNLDLSVIQKVLKSPSQDIRRSLKKGADLENPLIVPDGYHIGIFADLKNFGLPRVLGFDKNGVLFTSLTKDGGVVALPDKDNDGITDQIITVLAGLNNPHGIEFYEEYLYIAESDKVVRYKYNPESFTVGKSELLFNLPDGGRHFTRTIKIHDNKLYTSVGSSCDVCLENDSKRAAILVSELDGVNLRLFAGGLRNTVFFDFDTHGKLWGNDMGRDFLGNDIPPDELNLITEGANYGWPRCFGNRVRDERYRTWESLEACSKTTPSVYDYPAHVAPLGIRFINSVVFPQNDQGDILVAFHGSWNASPPRGYKIVKLETDGEKIISMKDFISGWLTKEDEIIGRPVDMIFADDGVLFISDDKAGVVYIVNKEL